MNNEHNNIIPLAPRQELEHTPLATSPKAKEQLQMVLDALAQQHKEESKFVPMAHNPLIDQMDDDVAAALTGVLQRLECDCDAEDDMHTTCDVCVLRFWYDNQDPADNHGRHHSYDISAFAYSDTDNGRTWTR